MFTGNFGSKRSILGNLCGEFFAKDVLAGPLFAKAVLLLKQKNRIRAIALIYQMQISRCF